MELNFPFDISGLRTIHFKFNFAVSSYLSKHLEDCIAELFSEGYDTPIYDKLFFSGKFRDKISKKLFDTEKEIGKKVSATNQTEAAIIKAFEEISDNAIKTLEKKLQEKSFTVTLTQKV